jgi:hypothetical protein
MVERRWGEEGACGLRGGGTRPFWEDTEVVRGGVLHSACDVAMGASIRVVVLCLFSKQCVTSVQCKTVPPRRRGGVPVSDIRGGAGRFRPDARRGRRNADLVIILIIID